MEMTPDEFVEFVKNEMLKYQELETLAKRGVFPNLFSRGKRKTYNAYTDVGITSEVETISLPKSEVKVFNLFSDIRIGVEYHIPIERKGFDQLQAIKNAYPRGVIQYNFDGDNRDGLGFANTLFNLQKRICSKVYLSEVGNKVIPSLAIVEGKPLEEAVEKFFFEIYRARGISLKDAIGD